MSLTPRQIAGIAVATLGLTIPVGCSQDEGTATPERSTVPTQPNSPLGPEAPSLPTVPDLGEPIPYSINCGARGSQDANNPGTFSGEHFLITNNDDNQAQIEHVRLPLDVLYENGSDEAFIGAIETSRGTIGAVVIPTDVNGSAIISYPDTVEGQVQKYHIAVSQDGTISISPNPELMGGVSMQTFVDAQGHQINLAAFENSNGDSIISFLNPGKDEWDNIADAPKKPGTSADHGFTEFEDGQGIYLNIPISRYGQTRAGVQYFDPAGQAACEILTGDSAETSSYQTISF